MGSFFVTVGTLVGGTTAAAASTAATTAAVTAGATVAQASIAATAAAAAATATTAALGFSVVTGVASFGLSVLGSMQSNVAQGQAVQSQSAAINRQADVQSAEIVRQSEFQQIQLEDDRRIQRINADLQEVSRQRDLRRILASQKALAAGRFDVSTSRSFLALTEETTRTAERDIEAIRLGADLAERRSILQQEEIGAGAEAGVLATQAGAETRIAGLGAAAKSSRTSSIISTVGSLGRNVIAPIAKGRFA